MKNKYVKLSAVVFILSSILVLTACNTASDSGTGGSAKAQEKFTISVANMGLSNLNVIKEKGWLEEEFAKIGADVEWSNHPAGPPINEGIASKRIDLAVLGEGAILSAINNKIDIKLISQLSNGLYGVNYLIVPGNSDIKELADLKGKQIGVNLGTSHHVFLLKALQSVGLKQDDVKAVNLTITDAQPAFQSGQLDAWITADPFASIEVNTNGAKLIASGESLNIVSPTFYIARGEFAKEHPEAVEIFLKTIDRALQLEKDNHEEFINLAVKSSGRDRALVETFSNNAKYENGVPSDEVLNQLQSSADILKDLGYLTKAIEVKPAVDSTYIEKLKK
ncbi:putative aliphatic sulfonates-binding protein precursor [compost metagenome]